MTEVDLLRLAALAVAAGGAASLGVLRGTLAGTDAARDLGRAVRRVGGGSLVLGLVLTGLLQARGGPWPGPLALLHAAAGLTWLGVLPWLVWLVGRLEGDEAQAVRTVRRLAAAGGVALGVVAVTGVLRAAGATTGAADLLATAYGRLVLVKGAAGLLILALGVASVAGAGLRRAQVAAALQAALGLGLLALSVRLAEAPPPAAVAPAWPLDVRPTLAALPPGMGRTLALAAGLGLAGLAALAAALVTRGVRRTACLLGGFALAAAILIALPARPYLLIDAYPTTFARPAPYTAASVARGLALYGRHCAACHGSDGRGDRVAAVTLGLAPPDLASPHTRMHTPGDAFWWVTSGIAPSDGRGLAVCETATRVVVPGTTPALLRTALSMPAFGSRLTEAERWDLVSAVRLLGDAAAAARLSAEPAPATGVRAPDVGLAAGRAALVVLSAPAARRRHLAEVSAALRAGGLEVLFLDDPDARAAYARLAPGDPPDGHAEFLVDVRGEVRARWRPGLLPSWEDHARLLAAAQRLAR